LSQVKAEVKQEVKPEIHEDVADAGVISSISIKVRSHSAADDAITVHAQSIDKHAVSIASPLHRTSRAMRT
jgi:hypothetical protein